MLRAPVRLILALLTLPTLASGPALAQPPAIPTRNMQVLAQFHDYGGYASCWGYVHGDGREYAVIGTDNGTAIYNVTDPQNSYFVGFIGGTSSPWREMKTYRNWIYVVTEGNTSATTPGLQIIRMTDPENPVLAATYLGVHTRSHTVSVDTTRALLVCNGTRNAAGEQTGMRILSLANPESPVEIGAWPAGIPASQSEYVHDSVPVGNRLYASSIYAGTQRVLDFTNPAIPFPIASWSYPGGFTHNSWPDPTGQFLYVTDEVNGQPLKVFDISNLASPSLVGSLTPNPHAIVHNAHVNGNELYLANYTEGVRVLDISDPAHPAQFAWADTWLGPSGGFNGVWGVYPYFPSGTVIASDMSSGLNGGLWVMRPTRDYGIVRVEVTMEGGAAAATSCGLGGSCCCAPGPCDCAHGSGPNAMEGVMVRMDGVDSLATPADGIVQFAVSAGTHQVTIDAFGYMPASASTSVANGERDTIPIVLVAKPRVDFSGVVRSAANSAALANAEVNLEYTPIHQHTGAAGDYLLSQVPDGLYQVAVRRPGYVPKVFDRYIGPGFATTQDFSLTPASLYDPLENSSGWSLVLTSDNAGNDGRWRLGEPRGSTTETSQASRADPASSLRSVAAPSSPGTIKDRPGLYHGGHEGEGLAPAPVEPSSDRSPAVTDSMCFYTGINNFPNQPFIGDVDGGVTTLTSRAFDATGILQPTFSVWVWFYGERSDEDYLAVLISGNNGTSWVPVDTLRGVHNHWSEMLIPIASYVTPGVNTKLRFVAADMGNNTLVEAAIDDVSLFSGTQLAVEVPKVPSGRLAFRTPRPNPASGPVALWLDLPVAGDVQAEIVDVSGRRVRTLHRGAAPAGVLDLSWNGTDASGRPAPAGLYFARARSRDAEAVTRLVRVR